MRVVLDTVVFVRALIKPDSVCGRILFNHHHRYTLVVSRQATEETLEVLARSGLRRKFPPIGSFHMDHILAVIASAEVVAVDEVPSVSRDRNDDIFLATAVAARATHLVSEDNDLLVLKEYGGTRILTCAGFIAALEAGG